MKKENIGFVETYLTEKYADYSVINTMATTKNKKNLKDIYIPLTLTLQEGNSSKERVQRKIVVDGFPHEFSEGSRKTLIVDTAGMGKSTMVKRIFLDLVERREYIPLFIELRRLTEVKTIQNEMLDMLKISSLPDGKDQLEQLFNSEKIVFILDGYDEIPLEMREVVTKQITSLIQQNGSHIFVMTSRPEDAFQGFQDFACYKIAPLTRTQSFELLKKHDNDGDTSQLLVKKLKTNEYGAISEYLTNPLLVSMLYAAFNFKQAIPMKKHLFYEQVYDAYFEKHDLTKGDGFQHQKQTNLDSYDFDRVLRAIGYNSLKRQKVEFTHQELIDTISYAKEECTNLTFKPIDMKNDLLEAVPLFRRDSLYFKWVHKSMQEYFAARFIYMDAKYTQDQMLTAMYNSNKIEIYSNLFDIYFDIDNYSFKKNIVLPFLQDYCNYYNRTYHEVKGISDVLVRERTGLMYGRNVWLGNNGSEKAEDDFEFLEQKCNDAKINYTNLVSYTFKDGRYCVVNERLNVRRILLPLFYSRMPELFVKSPTRNSFSIKTAKLKYSFKKVDGIDSFSNSVDEYRFCNYALMRGISEPNYYLDYEKSKEEIGRILETKKHKEEINQMIEGL